ncbi:MAG: hypothetical protein P857_839 [Candidatus Xenolissoclinum pacificiensis L6]|uniref:Uncharacterized protein n=1 Tax=Candidatus Xenolissoclinum pacificiensis L6 TaxID=1401685 RepID=W2V0A2_9RICK|nr:MAG: hypothetical protein P857_839 [Candidatus Xenolissoclinum pacificiensis L6]
MLLDDISRKVLKCILVVLNPDVLNAKSVSWSQFNPKPVIISTLGVMIIQLAYSDSILFLA